MKFTWRSTSLSLAALGCLIAGLILASTAIAGPLDISSFPAPTALDLTSGTVVFNTGTGTPNNPTGAPSLTINGSTQLVSDYKVGQPSVTENGVANWGSEIIVFSFSDVSLGPSVTVQVTGSRPIAILSHAGFSLQTAINASGANGLPGSSGTGGAGGAGGIGSASGSNGLVAQSGEPAPGSGPGAGPTLTLAGFSDGASASFGGAAGNDFFSESPPGAVYGDLTTHLEGGSSGGGGYRVNGTAGGGGGGGGAVELGALGTLTIGAAVNANGGTGSTGVSSSGAIAGGNGSGGGILLFGQSVAFNSSVSVAANGGGGGNNLAGGGGGGRVAVYGSNYTLGVSNGLAANASGNQGGGANGTAGVISVDPNLVTVPTGQSLSLTGQWTTVRNASGFTTPQLDLLVTQDVSVTGGTVTFAGSNVLSSTANLSLSAGSVNLAGFTQTLASLTLGGGNLAGPGLLKVNSQITASGGTSAAFVVGAAGLLKTGSGTFTLPGTFLYSGPTEVSLGTLNVPTGNSTSSAFHVDGGATLTAAGTLGSPFTSDANSTTTATGALTLGNNTNNAVVLNGALNVGANPVTLVSISTINISGATSIAGGTLTSASPLDLKATGSISGSGAVSAQLATEPGSQITATGPLTLGSLSSPSGVNLGGSLAVGSQQVVLLSAAKAPLGSSTTIGAGGNLATINGALLPSTDSLTATGAAVVAGDFTNQGVVNGPTAVGAALEFRNNVNGAGAFTGQITIDGVFSPGNSPAAVSLESLDLPGTSTLNMEIAGLIAGSQYDQLNLTHQLQLAGKLQVELINPGFTPDLEDQFDLLNAPAIGGQFSSISLPALPTGLYWDSSQLYSSGVISVVPEPATATLTGVAGAIVALASLVSRRRRINAGRVKA